MKEFKINEFLSLKLEENKTNFYVNGKLFEQCKFLMLNIPIEDTQKFEDIESIDEVANRLGWTYNGQQGVKYDLDPKTEFWGHCSNLQAWYEHNYDTRLLHSNLAFPLLKKLANVGDPLANKVIKEEIARRFESGAHTVITCIIEVGFLKFLNKEELKLLTEQNFPIILTAVNKLNDYNQYKVLSGLLEVAKENKWIEEYFPAFLEIIKKINDYYNYQALNALIEVAKENKWIEEYIPSILEIIRATNNISPYFHLFELVKERRLIVKYLPAILETIETLHYPLPGGEQKQNAFFALILVAKEEDWIEEHFLTFLETVNKFTYHFNYKYRSFFHLIDSIKSTEIMPRFYSQIETLFLSFLKSVDDIPGKRDPLDKIPDSRKYDAFSILLKVAKITRLGKKHFSTLLETIDKLGCWENKAITALLEVAKIIGLEKEHFPSILEFIDKLSDYQLYDPFSVLLEVAKKEKYIEELFPAFLEILGKLPDYKQDDAFSSLLKVAKETGLIEELFPVFWEALDKLKSIYKYLAFSDLVDSIKDTELLNRKYPQIKDQFLILLKDIDSKGYYALSYLIKTSNEMGCLEEHFFDFLEKIDNLDFNKDHAFSDLFELIKVTDLLNKHSYQIETQFLAVLNNLDKTHGFHLSKYDAFYNLIDSIKDTELSNKFHSQIETQFISFVENFNRLEYRHKYGAFSKLLEIVKITGVKKEHFIALVESMNKLPRNYDTYTSISDVFSNLFKVAKRTGWRTEYFSAFFKTIDRIPGHSRYEAFSSLLKIEKKNGLRKELFPAFLEILGKLPSFHKLKAFSALLKVAKETEWVEELFPIFLETIDKLLEKNKDPAFSKWIEAIEDSELEKKPAFQEWKEKNKLKFNSSKE